MRISPRTLILIAFLAACSQAAPEFSLASATVDSTHWCAGGATNAAYDLHATIEARNDTAKAVTIDSASARMVLAAVTGSWLEPVGDVYDASTVSVTPQTVAAKSRSTLDVTIPSACTSGMYGNGMSSSGQYRVTVRLETSAGSFSVTASNRHEILGA